MPSKNLTIILAISIFLVGIGAGVLISLLVFQAPPTPEPPVDAFGPTPAVNRDDFTNLPSGTLVKENWQTYRNEEYGFEVRYPGDWTPEFKNVGIKLIPIEKTKPERIFINIIASIQRPEDWSLGEWLA